MAQLYQLRPFQEGPIPGARVLLVESRFQAAIADELARRRTRLIAVLRGDGEEQGPTPGG